MRSKVCCNKYISVASARKIKKKQRDMQMREFERKGKKCKKVHFYDALDEILKGVKL